MESITPIVLFIYIIIQPILDTYYLYTDKTIEIFSISPATVIRYVGIFVLLFMTIYTYGFRKRSKWLLIYLAAVAVYFIFHCLNAYQFNSLVHGDFGFSIIHEAMYVFRLTLPILLIYVICENKIDLRFFTNCITVLGITISGLLILTNLFKISLDSYTNEIIRDNIFSWFFNGYENDGFNGLASKAYFNFANQISVILCMLLPISIYIAFHNKKVISYVAVFMQSISMLMVGTRTSTFGVVLVLACTLFVYIFIILLNKAERPEKKDILKNVVIFICIFLVTIVIFPKSPALYRSQVSNNYIQNFEPPDTDDEDEKAEDASDPLFQKLKKSGVSSYFYLKSYPFHFDREYWEGIVKLDNSKRLQNRYIEESMLKRVKEINNNWADDLLGITYTRTSNIYNLEKDFIYQYYSMGIAGVILFLGPYILFLLYGIIKCLAKFKDCFNFKTISILFGIALTLGTSYYCGNSIDALFVTTLLALLCGMELIILSDTKDQADKSVFGFLKKARCDRSIRENESDNKKDNQ